MGYISLAINEGSKWFFSFSRVDQKGYTTCAAGPLHTIDSPALIPPTTSGMPGQEVAKTRGAPGLESAADQNWFVSPSVNGLGWAGSQEVEIQNIEQFVLTLVDDETMQHVNSGGVLVGDVIGFFASFQINRQNKPKTHD
jgi:hypothetical protein